VFTLKLLGFNLAANYDASFGEWGNEDGFPIEK
jgi:3-mercaptopyruvate sulfurtransferase SseA